MGNKNSVGVVHDEESRLKISRSKQKPVAMCKDGQIIQTFPSAKLAQCSTGISRKNISLCCHNERKHAGGYEWKFV